MKSLPLLHAVLLSVALAAPVARLDAKIGALGRIIPAGDLINLAGVGVVAVVHVKEGDVVEANAPLVTFASRQAAQNDVILAELALREAEELGQLSLDALELKTEGVKRDFDFATLRHDRFNKLGGEELSPQQMELRAYQMKNSELSYKAAKKDLERTKLDREIKITKARTQLAIAQEKLNSTVLSAPAKLTVVKLAAIPGTVPSGPAVTLANLAEMQVATEVFAGDLPSLKVGQEATVSSTSLPGPGKARVISISRIITGRAKVAEVLLRLDDPVAASKLLNLEVNVSIEN